MSMDDDAEIIAAARAERAPERHTVTMGRWRDSSPSRASSWPNGSSSAPSMWPRP